MDSKSGIGYIWHLQVSVPVHILTHLTDWFIISTIFPELYTTGSKLYEPFLLPQNELQIRSNYFM
jgi:hypothetical protein